MIKLKELEHREYLGKKCIYFEYKCKTKDESGNDQILFVSRFAFNGNDDYDSWIMQIILLQSGMRESQVYTKEFVMPKKNLDLTLICATGLRYFQNCLKEEMMKKMLMDFAISDFTEGM